MLEKQILEERTKRENKIKELEKSLELYIKQSKAPLKKEEHTIDRLKNKIVLFEAEKQEIAKYLAESQKLSVQAILSGEEFPSLFENLLKDSKQKTNQYEERKKLFRQ